jgi:hypothetical protein
MANRDTVEGLRSWARGGYAEEAGVELLARAFEGRFTDREWPWIRRCDRPGWFWVDADTLLDALGVFSGGERRVLTLVAALVGAGAVQDLPGLLSGLDRSHLHLLLAAMAHAGGSHQHSAPADDNGQLRLVRLPALMDWPASTVKVA